MTAKSFITLFYLPILYIKVLNQGIIYSLSHKLDKYYGIFQTFHNNDVYAIEVNVD